MSDRTTQVSPDATCLVVFCRVAFYSGIMSWVVGIFMDSTIRILVFVLLLFIIVVGGLSWVSSPWQLTALSLLVGSCPFLLAGVAILFSKQCGCHLDEAIEHKCLFCGFDLSSLVYAMFVSVWHAVWAIPLGILGCLGSAIWALSLSIL